MSGSACCVLLRFALPEDRRMWFRIGINLGDVMVHESDLHGDSVNVAARLQALADPGGILISGPVFEQVKNKLALGFDYLGPTSVKNIAADVPIYRVLLNLDAAAPPEIDRPAPAIDIRASKRGTRQHRLYVSAATAGTFIALLFAINMLSWDGDLWFQWPNLAVLFVFCLRVIRLYGRERLRDGGGSSHQRTILHGHSLLSRENTGNFRISGPIGSDAPP